MTNEGFKSVKWVHFPLHFSNVTSIHKFTSEGPKLLNKPGSHLFICEGLLCISESPSIVDWIFKFYFLNDSLQLPYRSIMICLSLKSTATAMDCNNHISSETWLWTVPGKSLDGIFYSWMDSKMSFTLSKKDLVFYWYWFLQDFLSSASFQSRGLPSLGSDEVYGCGPLDKSTRATPPFYGYLPWRRKWNKSSTSPPTIENETVTSRYTV